MKAVLDVGMYVSATIRADGHPAQVLNAWHNDEFELYTSLAILEDLRRVLGYPRIRKYHGWTDDEIDLFVRSLSIAAHLTPGEMEISIVKDDPTDDKIFACAKEAGADYIVSSDEHLTKIGRYEEISIVTPRQFLETLEEKKHE